MAAPGTSSDAGVYTSSHQGGLELELSILAALLERNRCSHGRTKYFQRLSMVHRCLKRHAIIDLYIHVQTLESELSQLKQRERKRRQREKVFWEIKGPADDETSRSLHDLRSDLRERLLRIEALVTGNMIEAVSRLDYAATALFAEIARGFFLPLNAVAVTAVARIRALLLRLAMHALQTMPSLQSAYRDVFQDDLNWTSDQLNTMMNRYHALSTWKPEGRMSEPDLVETTLKRMGVTLATMEAADSPRETDDIHSITYEAETDNYAMPNVSTDVGFSNDSDNDIGVAFAHDKTDHAEAAIITAFEEKQAIDQGIDVNYALVKQVALHEKERKRKNAKSKEKAIEDAVRKKKKKAKKADKEDFFDKLFGARS